MNLNNAHNKSGHSPRKKWYQKLWGKVLGAIGVITTCLMIIKAVYSVFEWYHEKEHALNKINEIETTLINVINENNKKNEKISKLEEYIDTKEKSYAVGFRVFREKNEETSDFIKRKMYRDWDGNWHEVHYDFELSTKFGVGYYYYIDKENGKKVYCW